MSTNSFPFHEVVGQDDAKLALILVSVDPQIGGVLLRGHKGTAKTTLARGLAQLLDDVPFVELPLGATEDRLVGTLDTTEALTGGGIKFQPGLLAEAHGGVLYVDEINLLADHLVDTLLDVTVSGENIVERDGLSHRHPARFVLIGSMNPEEGELRPQLLDRFGFCVEMTAPLEIDRRVEAISRRLAFEGLKLAHDVDTPTSHLGQLNVRPDGAMDLAGQIRSAPSAVLPIEILQIAARLAVEVGAEGLRADLALCRAAAALAGFEGSETVSQDDLRRIAPLVLAHRSRRGPFDSPSLDPDDLDAALNQAVNETSDDSSSSSTDPDQSPEPDIASDDSDEEPGEWEEPQIPQGSGQDRPLMLGGMQTTRTPPPKNVESARGRFIRDVPLSEGRSAAVLPTVRALAKRRTGDPEATLERTDLRSEVRASPAPRTVVICVDLSGSMGAEERGQTATGVVLGLLANAYQNRDKVALVTFGGSGAQVVLSPTSSIEVARNRLNQLATGGHTPLAEGLKQALQLGEVAESQGSEALLVVLTDGRATGKDDALEAALTAAATVRERGISSMVLDCEMGPVRLGLAEQLALAMDARYVVANHLESSTIADLIKRPRSRHGQARP